MSEKSIGQTRNRSTDAFVLFGYFAQNLIQLRNVLAARRPACCKAYHSMRIVVLFPKANTDLLG